MHPLPSNISDFGKKILQDIGNGTQTLPLPEEYSMIIDKIDKRTTYSIISKIRNDFCNGQTNIDIENISYEDLCAMGIFKTIEETLINYKEIKDEIIISINLMFNYLIYNTLESLPTTKEMTDNLSEIRNIMVSNPEKAKEYANIIMANHPELKGFGELFEKILNNLNKKEWYTFWKAF